ncbi:periplasmic heavy metal sensor [Pontibaca methylaminivorans]|uniref:Heavy-metal resistance n=1 Tax=Pontibaca methylaminivorans TaxID=515897 RepID=A0A1R3X348_9RHOB|nr:periplasmic heavy metal sensor [Pontibaca methylaminivorans]SIT85078.1 Heavy-metal resistance [Pontibaca methylaminivorans]
MTPPESPSQPRPEPRPERRRAPRWMRVMLGVSLALNLAVVGLFAGMMLRHDRPGRMEAMHRPPVGVALYRALSKDERQTLRESLRRKAAGQRSADAASGDTGAASVVAALRARPFDRDRLAAALADESSRRQRWQDLMQAAWLEQVTAMDDAARAEFADRVERLTGHGHRPDRSRTAPRD